MTARFGAVIVVLGGVLAMAAARLVSEGRSALSASDAAWAKGDAVTAAVHARSAARAYVPGASHTELGYQRLRDIAETSERRGNRDAALFAWRAVLSADIGSRPFSVATSEARAVAEASVARLHAVLLTSGRTPAAARASADPSTAAAAVVPGVAWGAFLLAGAALWYGAGLRLSSRGWGNDGRIVLAEIRIAAVMALAGLLAWLAGLFLV